MGLFRKFATLCRIWNTKNLLKNVKFMMEKDFDEVLMMTKDDVIEECVFELEEMKTRLLPLQPSVLNKEASLNLLKNEPKSFARIGDGEIAIMEGKSLSFQKYEKVLAEKMLRLLKEKRDDMYVGINEYYFHARQPYFNKLSRMFYRKNMARLRRFLLENTNPEIQYLDAGAFIGYFWHYETGVYENLIDTRKRLFEGKKIVLVTGDSVKAKWDYDVFELAASRQYIQAPSKNAFQEYDSILNDINHNVSKDTLVCLILGPTATAMAADLTDLGYMVWDVGHIAKDYDAYMKKLEKTSEVQADFYAPD